MTMNTSIPRTETIMRWQSEALQAWELLQTLDREEA